MRWHLPRRRRDRRDGAAPSSRRGLLFVVGAARGGTTILQNALNDARDIYLLGEPDLHLESDEPGFAARYNAMHEGWGNQPTKSTRLPPLLAVDGAWDAHLDRLGALYRWVGTKIVANPGSPGWLARFDALHGGRFHDAHHLFVFREPGAVLGSTLGFQAATGARETAAAILANYADLVGMFTRMARTQPSVRAIVHEDVDGGVFERLSAWLDVPLAGAAGYYDFGRARHHDIGPISAEDAHGLDLLRAVYADLRTGVANGFERLQIEQNSRNPDPTHLTALGSIHARAELVARFLRGKP